VAGSAKALIPGHNLRTSDGLTRKSETADTVPGKQKDGQVAVLSDVRGEDYLVVRRAGVPRHALSKLPPQRQPSPSRPDKHRQAKS
jgi:hypothetical protein